eukprot:1995441-Pleurochrysis_carterae.AAC.2
MTATLAGERGKSERVRFAPPSSFARKRPSLIGACPRARCRAPTESTERARRAGSGWVRACVRACVMCARARAC